MIEHEVRIINRAGLHTRPSAMLVKIASAYKSDFYLSRDGLRVNGKSIIGVMTLAAAYGSEMLLEFNGPDEEEMASEVLQYFQRGFDEI